MNLDFDDTELAFRDEVREFFAEAVTPAHRSRLRAGLRLDPVEIVAWQKRLAARGWAAPTWPVEHGGCGWSPTQVYIFELEAARADAPIQFHQGLELIGPIIFTLGTPEQKAKYLPRILSGDDWWCQGYTEPGAGSDLAGLKTRAVRDGDDYVVTGQKMWTSYAHVATMMFCLVRTSTEARKQSGLSMLLIDMKSPGLKVQPIETMDEKRHSNEVFLDEVRVPAANLIGEEGKGWDYGKVLLDRERSFGAASALRLSQHLRGLRAAAAERGVMGDPVFRAALAQIEIETLAVEMMVMRLMADASAGKDSGPRASMLKLRWSELLQAITELWFETLGYDAAAFRALDNSTNTVDADLGYAVQGALNSRVTTIYGGSSEIQRNIIARRNLGL
ncbi:acyl-CoA dehydrogenase [Sphingomonas sp. Leaf357]|uniref:acyl-CoA dehydrogenase family protein n=1 Tax=Sphingomonas sp. Leaf357 TaxID=1736350 RepID=UPI0006F9FD4A|nr:acyl-CoA dehydrogenase family protein [Sphingomonas sp. Leaf357]KQS05166.1 acyl-CoA dehydrogenase [Sphingomonas sp. Leaf357]